MDSSQVFQMCIFPLSYDGLLSRSVKLFKGFLEKAAMENESK